MKRIYAALLFIFIAAAAEAQTIRLNSFEQLMHALESGEEVRAVIHYSKCRLLIDGVETTAPDAIGGMSLGVFEYFAKMSIRNEKAFVAASESVLISHPVYGYVLNYAKLRIYEDDSAEIIVRYLDPVNYEVKMDETFYTGINSGLFLFKKN